MSIIADKAKELKKLVEMQPDFAREIVISEPEFIEDLVTFQLDKGITGDGETLPKYSQTSVTKFGKPPGPIRLYDTGDFWKSIQSKVSQDYFTTDATDSKTIGLKEVYEPAIDKLNDDSINQLIDELLIPELRVHNKRQLQ